MQRGLLAKPPSHRILGLFSHFQYISQLAAVNSLFFVPCAKRTKRPLVLIVNGKAEAVVQDTKPIRI